jgi:amino acid permease
VYDPDEGEIYDGMEEADGKTPVTKRRMQDEAHENEGKNVKKLGPLATCFTIFKGFVATGVLYVPKDFKNGGYIFTPITLVASMVLTLYCAKLLLEVHAKTGGSFPSMGFKAYGKPGKIFVEIVLVASQFGFCTAYVYFIASQIGGQGGVIPCITGDTEQCVGGLELNRWVWMPICMAIYVPLVLVRRIEVFAVTHLFADVMIVLTIIIVCIYAGIDIKSDGI